MRRLFLDTSYVIALTTPADAYHSRANALAHALLCTVTWRFAAEIIAARFGFVAWSGTEIERDQHGRLCGHPSRHFDEYDKQVFVEDYCHRNRIPLHQVFAVGDARSDLPLFTAVGFSLALNASQDAKNAATAVLDTSDLRQIFEVIPGFKKSNYSASENG